MPKKVDAARRCADLLAALARTANVRLALKECGVSHYWAYRQRRRDGDFDARWRTAVRNGRRALAKAAAARAHDPGAPRPAATLVTAGSSGRGTIRLERVKPTSFTPERRAAFLDALRATCNVREAAAAAGVSPTGAYRWFHADAAFRAAWEAALVEGRVHLEMALMGAARALFEAPDGQAHPIGSEAPSKQVRAPVSPADVRGMDAKVALQLLRLHGPRADGAARGRWVKPADADETRREILAKVAAVRASREGAGSEPERRGRVGMTRAGAVPGSAPLPGPLPSGERETRRDPDRRPG